MYLLGQWSSAPDGDDDLRLDDNAMVIVKEEEGGWGGPGEVEDSNRKEVEKAMGEWLVDGLVVLGVYAEMHGRRGAWVDLFAFLHNIQYVTSQQARYRDARRSPFEFS